MRTLIAILCVPVLALGAERDEKLAANPNVERSNVFASLPKSTRNDPIGALKDKIAKLEKRAARAPEDWTLWSNYARVHIKYNTPKLSQDDLTLEKVEAEARRFLSEDIAAAKLELAAARSELLRLELLDLERRKVEAAEAQADAIFEQNAIMRAEAEQRGVFIPRR
jgi:hypothetical protein